MNNQERVLMSAKLTEQEVLEIHASDKTLRSLAKQYDVHHATIHSIKLEKSWKYLWAEEA